jgi:hypothetical protein
MLECPAILASVNASQPASASRVNAVCLSVYAGNGLIANTKPFTYRLVTLTESWEAQSWAKPQLVHSFAVDIETNWT